ncbi:4-hydroxythreonine-4-phosphate dehydrogenase PdxA [Micromonospora soli]|uniref:4-hydroxythreonine-4-phosphate dehydrogenase PdxA n=1 Tax=Micromonospora sp. NBRC 110009 TaxID=3061627 RepID=UPI002673F9C7|nr:4-hydroxythreonine-4-phosphate dehydrogenase PdxA [Micromonospora sp. NBRC 110009]WKT98459.1 4-hydroxythreonine-4-phosphate dehydrogenase PdxA [Micromonospora sp. NBRC 110009]
MRKTVSEAPPRVALTMGDPAGIGPELTVRLLATPENLHKAEVYVLTDAAELKAVAAEVGVEVPLTDAPTPGHAVLVGSDLSGRPVERRTVSKAAGERVMADLLKALNLYRSGMVDAIMFTPLNKGSLHLAGMHEEDELRWFAKNLGFEGTTSELNFIPGLVTSRVTSHIPLKDVAARINADSVLAAIRLLDDVLKASGIAAPRLAVCALNPHAGENGQFGREEIEHIAPGVAAARAQGMDATGPYPCDTVFIKARNGDFDGVITMYHDQGQIAMKLMGFDRGVTVQGGLPVPIATPAHGTAFEIVGKGVANLGPSQHAYDLAVALGRRNRQNRR